MPNRILKRWPILMFVSAGATLNPSPVSAQETPPSSKDASTSEVLPSDQHSSAGHQLTHSDVSSVPPAASGSKKERPAVPAATSDDGVQPPTPLNSQPPEAPTRSASDEIPRTGGPPVTSVPEPSRAASAKEPSHQEPPLESNVVSLAGREGFRWTTRGGDFLFNPYTLVQTYAQATYVSNQWLNLADQDNVRAMGFGTPYALIGVAGRGFDRVTFNVAVNAACTGGCLLNQAWMDVEVSKALKIQVGKFKTPMHWAYQVRLGQAQFARLPSSLAAGVNLPFGLNAVTPSIGMGFDTGVMVHGILAEQVQYQFGVFNGEGINVNSPTSTMSDDHRWLPGLLYAGRVTYEPLGAMKPEEGAGQPGAPIRVHVGVSSSLNMEANAETSNDWRSGLELAIRKGPGYFAAEAYSLRMAFVERQRGESSRLFWGSYAQVGYTMGNGIEPVARVEVFDRNSTAERGVLLLPAVGVNWYIVGQNLKLQASYQTLVRKGYASDLASHQDDNAIADHTGIIQLQFSL